jgi:hypothetical protein
LVPMARDKAGVLVETVRNMSQSTTNFLKQKMAIQVQFFFAVFLSTVNLQVKIRALEDCWVGEE